jgi:hypothetical protein
LNSHSRSPSRREFLARACALSAAPIAAGGLATEQARAALGSAQPSFAPGLDAVKIDSLKLSRAQRAFLLPIAALWEINVGNSPPVTEFHVETALCERSGK